MKIRYLAAALVLASSAWAQTSERYDLKIEAQPLAQALQTLASQADLQVLFFSEVSSGLTSKPLLGNLTQEQALQKLLEGTGLSFRFINERTVTIRAAQAERDERTSAVSADESALLLAQAGDVRPVPADPQKTPPPSDDEATELEEVVVTGTHIRGVENNTAPIFVLDRAYIDSTGITTASRLIESLPQNFALASQSGVLVPGVSHPALQGSSINLRAIGEGTTLTLLNGRRMPLGFLGSAVDISALPLSAVERVEVLTDGASALYGSDAVGGVVNFILRRDFEGAETRLQTGWADGVDEHRVSQVLGTAWESGNALLSLEYYKRDLLRASEREFVPNDSIIGSLFPQDKNYAVMFTGRQALAERVDVFADALYTRRKTYNEGGQTIFNQSSATKNPQASATLGLDWRLGQDWQLEISGSYARNSVDQVQETLLVDSLFEFEAAQIKADGAVFEWPAGSVRLAVGVDWRAETLDIHTVNKDATGLYDADFDQIVRSAFGEVYVPLIGPDNARRGIHRLELSVAGRFDDYSSFGSSFDPQVGLMWEPVRGLRLRSVYGTSYKAPKLDDYDLTFNDAIALYFTDPQAPSGISHQLWMGGKDAGALVAQESESLSLGFEIEPSGAPGLQLGLNYYRIDYRDQIVGPLDPFLVLGNQASFGSAVVRDPTLAQIEEAIALGEEHAGFLTLGPNFEFPDPNFTPESVEVIFDLRRRNRSVLKTNGLDATIQYGFSVGGAKVSLGLAGTYIFKLEQQPTPGSEPLDPLGTFNNPTELRLRGSFGWQKQAWAANLFVNYTDSYTDNRLAPAVSPVAMRSYTTVDARLAHDFSAYLSGGFWSGVTIALSAQNLFDQDPPPARILVPSRDMGFDPTNANPMGRMLALELSKRW